MRLLHHGPVSLSLAVILSCLLFVVSGPMAGGGDSEAQVAPNAEYADESEKQAQPKPNPADNAFWPVVHVEFQPDGGAKITHEWPPKDCKEQLCPPLKKAEEAATLSAIFLFPNGDEKGPGEVAKAEIQRKVPGSDQWGRPEPAETLGEKTSDGGTRITVSTKVKKSEEVRLVYSSSNSGWKVNKYQIMMAGEQFDKCGAVIDAGQGEFQIAMIALLSNKSGGAWLHGKARITLLFKDTQKNKCPPTHSCELLNSIRHLAEDSVLYRREPLKIEAKSKTAAEDLKKIVTTFNTDADWPFKEYGEGPITASKWLEKELGEFGSSGKVPEKKGDPLGTFTKKGSPLVTVAKPPIRVAESIVNSILRYIAFELVTVSLEKESKSLSKVELTKSNSAIILLGPDVLAPGIESLVLRWSQEELPFSLPPIPTPADRTRLAKQAEVLPQILPLPGAKHMAAGIKQLQSAVTMLKGMDDLIKAREAIDAEYSRQSQIAFPRGCRTPAEVIQRDRQLSALRALHQKSASAVDELAAVYRTMVGAIDAQEGWDRSSSHFASGTFAPLSLLGIQSGADVSELSESAVSATADGTVGQANSPPFESSGPGNPQRFTPALSSTRAGRIRVLLASESRADDPKGLKDGLQASLGVVECFFRDAFETQGSLDLQTKVAGSLNEVRHYFTEPGFSPSDTLVFYFCGHGGTDSAYDAQSLGFALSDGTLELHELIGMMNRHKPQCAIIITDCCSRGPGGGTETIKESREKLGEFIGNITPQSSPTGFNRQLVDKLFLKHRGTICITGASPTRNQFGFFQSTFGGTFTHSLISVLRSDLSGIRQPPTLFPGEADWRQIFCEVQSRTSALSLGRATPPSGYEIRLLNQATLNNVWQLPYVYSLQ